MGIGVVAGDRLKMVVVARFHLSPSEWAQWKRAFSKFSEQLYDATQGQLQIGDVYFADDNNGSASADVLLYASGDPSFSQGRFGTATGKFHLMPYVKKQVLTFMHELGHNLWGLGEEYARAQTFHPIDTSSPAPDKKTIPISPSSLTTDQLVTEQASALLVIGGQIERHTVVANTSTSITVDTDFSVLPTDADEDTVFLQRPAECATAAGANFCIMEKSRSAAGELAPDGTWTPAANPVTEFCTDTNHDPDLDTHQETSNHDSCWETIVTEPGFTSFTLPDPAAAGPATGSAPVNFFVLDPDPRFAIVLDRSGSMADGTKLPDAKHGAHYWVEFCAAAGDRLTVVWYDHEQALLLPLTEVDTLTANQRQQLTQDIDALTPRGSTGIRDALLAALAEVSSPPTRAATQVAVLLTDGIHNTPWLSQAQEAIPPLRENGLRVYALGVGSPNEVDMPTLDAIATGTGGRSYAVGTNQPNAIETALVEINAEVRGGIIASIPATLPDARNAPADKRWAVAAREGERPPFKAVAKAFGIEIVDGEVRIEREDRVLAVRVFVEERADRASFTLLHPEGESPWLYLVDPSGTPVEIGEPGHTHVQSDSPHEFSLVDGPKAGWWTVLVVRPSGGSGYTVRVVGGIEHKGLDVVATARASGEDGDVIDVVAGASYGLPLTALRVRCQLTAPSGRTVGFVLDDRDDTGERTGTYRGSFRADEVGLYRGTVRIEGTTVSRHAMALTRVLHLEDGAEQLDVTADVPPFRRVVPVQVLVRKQGSVFEPDRREEKWVERPRREWTRPTALRSAPLRPRSQTARRPAKDRG
ncbi:MAG TPA: VWA domain-containing protein [Frankiaceae bacterium]|nr:VWA domain-containing protein [Frankiaceae bacterium]